MHMNADSNLPAPTRKRVGVRGYKWGCNGDGGRGGAGLGASTDELIAALHPISTTGADGPMPEAGDRGYDVILLADVIFNHVAHAALLRSCHALLRPHDPAACVLVAFLHRHVAVLCNLGLHRRLCHLKRVARVSRVHTHAQ